MGTQITEMTAMNLMQGRDHIHTYRFAVLLLYLPPHTHTHPGVEGWGGVLRQQTLLYLEDDTLTSWTDTL